MFFDPRLSVTGRHSCASCHRPELAFTDGRPVGVGATGEPLARNVPSLANVVYRPVLNWFDPTMRRLEEQLLTPLLARHPVELGADEASIARLLNIDATYRDLFARLFAGPASLGDAARAIAAFERTLISFSAPWDRHRAGETDAISPAAKRGELLFFSERTQCFRCHPAPHFTDTYRSADLPFDEIAFHDIGLDGGGPARVRAPSLRNASLTAPYMHDGSVPSLGAVVDLYMSGGRGAGRERAGKSAYVQGFALSVAEKDDLIAFIESLSDPDFIADRRFSDPFAPRAE